MTQFLRQANTATKYVVSGVVFVVCVAKTRPGTSVLPAYYLLCSLGLAACVKGLKRLFRQPRPLARASVVAASSSSSPKVVIGGGEGRDGDNSAVAASSASDTDSADERDKRSAADDDADDDDLGMPSSHAAMLSYFSWTGVLSLFLHDALGLYSRAVAGLFRMFLPLVQLLADGLDAFAMLGNEGAAKLDLLAGGGGGGAMAHHDALAYSVLLVVLSTTLVLLGMVGSQLRVWNGDHSVAQALAGYLIGFFWASGSLVALVKVWRVDDAPMPVQWAWTTVAAVLGAIAGFLILRKKARRRGSPSSQPSGRVRERDDSRAAAARRADHAKAH